MRQKSRAMKEVIFENAIEEIVSTVKTNNHPVPTEPAVNLGNVM